MQAAKAQRHVENSAIENNGVSGIGWLMAAINTISVSACGSAGSENIKPANSWRKQQMKTV
jgi:hypothetical protein